MQDNTIENNILDGYRTFALDSLCKSNLAYRPQFLYNDSKKMMRVSTSLEKELANCQEFFISVAFITESGITPFLLTLQELEKKDIKGKILTTDYLTFSEPKALEKLSSLKNIELKMFCTENVNSGFHTKGYIFKQEELYHIIVGSSNWTANALNNNKEWNTKIISTSNGEIFKDVYSEFQNLWNSKNSKSYNEFIDDYKKKYLQAKIEREQKQIALASNPINLNTYNLKPNKMQLSFVEKLKSLYEKTKDSTCNKGILISATGTGKSFAAAFGMRELKAEKILFIVHREQIAKQAKFTFERVFGLNKTYGIFSGNLKENDKDFVFSTMQTISKDEYLKTFEPNEFDFIIIDECHHAGADSYTKIFNHFKPKFWLGMTASPDTDNYNIYELFNHNIIYEITLQQALDEDLLCTFHYFGITDITLEGEELNDEEKENAFSNLFSSERVKHIISKSEYFGYSGNRIKGLIFCRNIKEAKALSEEFNKTFNNGKYYKTEVITGDSKQEERETAIKKLTTDKDTEDKLDYLLTVDVFNEGVDIPEINQVIMLRPTKSIVVFIQQLGRGLRKYNNKEFVVIIDFIANYNNNFMIPMALYGDRSYNKDNMRRYIREGEKLIPGCSSIHFDEISRRKIYESIDKVKTNSTLFIIEAYESLKKRLNRIPSISDFEDYGSIDVTKIFTNNNYCSYHEFLKKKEKDYEFKNSLTIEMEEIIKFISKKLVLFKRTTDLILLKNLIKNSNKSGISFSSLFSIQNNIGDLEQSVFNNLTNNFLGEESKKSFKNCIFIEKNLDDTYSLAPNFNELLQNQIFCKMVNELIEFGILRNKKNYGNLYKDTNFQLYQKYTYEDVCRLLNWNKNLNAQNVGGYFYDKETKTFPVFINYEKCENAIGYEDRFISDDTLIALSKLKRKVDSQEAKYIYKRNEFKDTRIFLFVRKNKDDNEAKEFYFLGEINAIGNPKQVNITNHKDSYAFEIVYKLDVPIRIDIYDYIVNG